MLNQWEEESAAGCLSDLNHIDNAIREANRRLKSLDQEFTNEVKQLTVVQVSYGFGDDLWPALLQFFLFFNSNLNCFHSFTALVFTRQLTRQLTNPLMFCIMSEEVTQWKPWIIRITELEISLCKFTAENGHKRQVRRTTTQFPKQSRCLL